MATQNLKWNLENVKNVTVSVIDTDIVSEFDFTLVPGYMAPADPGKDADGTQLDNIYHLAFMHGMKQKLADHVSGFKGGAASKVDLISAKFRSMVRGSFNDRKSAESKFKQSDIRARYEALPDGPEKEAALALLKVMKLI